MLRQISLSFTRSSSSPNDNNTHTFTVSPLLRLSNTVYGVYETTNDAGIIALLVLFATTIISLKKNEVKVKVGQMQSNIRSRLGWPQVTCQGHG